MVYVIHLVMFHSEFSDEAMLLNKHKGLYEPLIFEREREIYTYECVYI